MTYIGKRKIFCVLLLLFAVAMLSGCTEDYDRDDIEAYVSENYGLEDFVVSPAPLEIVDEEDYTDYMWTVKLEDGSGIVFEVLDNYGWGMEWVTNYLCDNFSSAVLEHMYKEYGRSDLLKLHATKDLFNTASLQADFASRKELEALFAELQDFSLFVEENGYGTEIFAEFKMQHKLRNRCDYVIDDGDCIGWYLGEITEADYEEAWKEYLLTCLDYRLEEQLAEFTEEEIQLALKDFNYCISINRNGIPEFYDDLCASKYAYGISFGTLYELLCREGIAAEGTAWHYSFVGADGSTYEISYDFCDYLYVDDMESHTGYYYLKDGVQMPMNAYFYNHFSESEIKEMTGLDFIIAKWPESI